MEDKDLVKLRETLKDVINIATQRIHYAESRRSALAVMASALLAAGVAIFAITIEKVANPILEWGLGGLCTGLVVTAVLVFVTFARQTNYSYPFKGATRVWKWFYRDALPEPELFDVPWSARESPEYVTRRARLYEAQFPVFVARQTQLVDDKVNLFQDLQQVYVLHVNEGYKNAFLTLLRKTLNRGIMAAIVAGLLGAAFGYWQSRDKTTSSASDWRSSSVRVEARWRATQFTVKNGDTDALAVVNFHIMNLTNTPLRVSGVVARDKDGLSVPLSVISLPDSIVIPPHERYDLATAISIRMELLPLVSRFEIKS
jgi:hypothetical protein